MPPANLRTPHTRSLLPRLVAGMLCALLAPLAFANGPRWVTGPPYFNTSGNPVVWGIANINYFTDPADLSPYVNHAAADAIVAAAAGVWNVPTAYITLAQGGTLAEHVSSANSYISSNGPIFPADVEPANYSAIPIAVIYDSDGSITDMLLGSGASAPAECRQNAVTEDVDGIVPSGVIEHAILILNGRCTGPAPQQQLQLQYQLQRAFGRILGLSWSQTNDNVFTRSPQPTTLQAQNWPILHPIDIVCGAYTYQCLPSPFTLRDDDIASISALYDFFSWPPFPPPPAPGKQWSYLQAGELYGQLSFPTGQGMAGVNVVLRRWRGGTGGPQLYDDVSAVSGAAFRQNNGNPVTGVSSSLLASMGSFDPSLEGRYSFTWVPAIDPLGSYNGPMLGVIASQPINPLYSGAYTVGPNGLSAVSPSGALVSQATPNPIVPLRYGWDILNVNLPAPPNAASNCSSFSDGTETAPAAIDPSGWWTGVLCAYGHTAWSSLAMLPGRTATIEVTALDESSLATTAKAMPLIGVWASTDPTGTLPTVTATPSAFNTIAIGTTATHIVTNSSPQSLRFVIADARGDGRPDFAYRTRVLYADSVAPAAVSASGGLITIAGSGFRPGNKVVINGVTATVASWTNTTITAIAPPQSVFATQPSAPVFITVSDLSTGGSTTMSAALTYSSSIAPDIMALVAAPPSAVSVGTTTAFAVRVTLPDGLTPVAGLPVTFTWSGPAQLAGCFTSPCTLLTDSTGLASAAITTTTFGTVSLQASALGLTQSASFTSVTRSVNALQSTEYIAAGSIVSWTPQLAAIQNSAPATTLDVDWTASTGFSVSPASTTTDSQGIATTTATLGPLGSAAQATAQACAWSGIAPTPAPGLCATFTAIAVDPSALRIAIVSGANQTVTAPAAFAPVVLRVTDAAAHPVAGAAVNLHQTVDALEAPCPTHGPCPIPPVLASATASAISDVNGLVTVTPMQLPATGEVTNLAAAAGTQGFAALSLTQQP